MVGAALGQLQSLVRDHFLEDNRLRSDWTQSDLAFVDYSLGPNTREATHCNFGSL